MDSRSGGAVGGLCGSAGLYRPAGRHAGFLRRRSLWRRGERRLPGRGGAEPPGAPDSQPDGKLPAQRHDRRKRRGSGAGGGRRDLCVHPAFRGHQTAGHPGGGAAHRGTAPHRNRGGKHPSGGPPFYGVLRGAGGGRHLHGRGRHPDRGRHSVPGEGSFPAGSPNRHRRAGRPALWPGGKLPAVPGSGRRGPICQRCAGFLPGRVAAGPAGPLHPGHPSDGRPGASSGGHFSHHPGAGQ